MEQYSQECLEFFLDNQLQLFDERVAETTEEASEFLAEMMAVVVDSIVEVSEYFEESGMDTSDMSEDDLKNASEVFHLPNGSYLVVEG